MMARPWTLLVAGAAVVLLAGFGAAVAVRFANRGGLVADEFPLANTWHGRPARQADHDPVGPRGGFLLFLVTFLIFLALAVTAVEFLLFG